MEDVCFNTEQRQEILAFVLRHIEQMPQINHEAAAALIQAVLQKATLQTGDSLELFFPKVTWNMNPGDSLREKQEYGVKRVQRVMREHLQTVSVEQATLLILCVFARLRLGESKFNLLDEVTSELIEADTRNGGSLEDNFNETLNDHA
jgi:hypothetical protein